MSRVSTKELAQDLAKAKGISVETAHETIKETFVIIAKEMEAGKEVNVYGFGTFSSVERAARNGINPKTKEPLKIAASKAPKFKAAKGLKETIKAS